MITRHLYICLFPLMLSIVACSENAPPDDPGSAPPRLTVAPPAAPAAEPSPPASAPQAPAGAGATGGGPTEIEWDALIPEEFQPDKLMSEYAVDELSDDDPRAAELMAKLRELWDKAPVREDLDGASIRLPGFVVPVEADGNETTGFLLVPYYGACVHVPPPPANQTVYVVTERGKGAKPELFDVIWVTGTMSVKRIDNDIAEAGYTLYATDVAPYE